MVAVCVNCEDLIEIPEDIISGEIVSCRDCGLDYIVVRDESGELVSKELVIEGEHWGK